MNIIKRELRSNRKSLIIWAIVMFFMAYACMNKYSAGNAIPGGFNELMKTLPLGMQKMLGVGVFDLSNPIDYYAICFPYLALLTCIQAVMLGASVISKEERDKTTEFLMVKPVSREQILTSKFIASFVIMIILNLVTLFSSLGAISAFVKTSWDTAPVIKLMVAMFGMQILFFAIGTFFAAILNKSKLASAIGTGILVFSFLLSVIIDISGKIDYLKYISPFKYYEPKDIVKGGYSVIFPIISILLTVIGIAGTYYFYKKRDLKY